MFTIGTANSSDFSTLSSMPLTFSPLSVNGAEECTNLTAVSDSLVESEESFTIILEFVTSDEILRLGNAITMVTITDIDGVYDF